MFPSVLGKRGPNESDGPPKIVGGRVLNEFRDVNLILKSGKDEL